MPVDQPSYEKLRALPAGELHTLIDASVLVSSQSESSNHKFATITMNDSGCCPMLRKDKLCRIQAEVGEEFLPHTCATYPRILQRVGSLRETSLALSCPQAARLVLLDPHLLQSPAHQRSSSDRSASPSALGKESIQPRFWPTRKLVVRLATDRTYPLWQRLFLLGVLCRKLDSLLSDKKHAHFPAFLGDFGTAVFSGLLRAEMDALPVDWAAHLDVVLRLAGMMLNKSAVHPRFANCIQAFTAGIGNGPGATFESLTVRYAEAHDRTFRPFLDRHPYILENYLLNAIFRSLFPFGSEGLQPGATLSMVREHSQLMAQFALMRGLLIGVAGFYGDAFSVEHVVHTVQAASKHFEHHPEFLSQAHALLVESKMEGERGAAILGNTGTATPYLAAAASS